MSHSVSVKVEDHLPLVLNDCAAYGLAVFDLFFFNVMWEMMI